MHFSVCTAKTAYSSRQVRRSKTNRHRRTFFFFFQRQQLQHPPVVEERGKCALEMRSIDFFPSNQIESIQSNRQSPTSPKSSAQHKFIQRHRQRRQVHRQQCIAIIAKCIAIIANIGTIVAAKCIAIIANIGTIVAAKCIASPSSPTSAPSLLPSASHSQHRHLAHNLSSSTQRL